MTHLAQHLRLTDHHRIQRRSHAEQMPDCIFIGMPVKMIVQKTRGQLSRRIKKLRDTSGAQIDLIVCRRAQDLDTIASRDDQSFTHHLSIDECAQSGRARRVVKREAFADLDRSCLVIDSDQDYGHVLCVTCYLLPGASYFVLCALFTSLRPTQDTPLRQRTKNKALSTKHKQTNPQTS